MQPQPRYQPGDTIAGRYQVHQALMGGMGEVYLCLDLETIQPYALKTFQQRYLTNPKVRDLFKEEVATWVALEKHPNIVRCFYMDVIDNQPFMLLEWIAGDESRGTDLRSWLRHGPLDLRLALDFTIDICRGLIHAGQKQPGIVHRDLKPENILVAQGRLAKITDWGLARIIQGAELEISGEETEAGERQSLMDAGGIVGTPAYMAPEQWRGEELDARTDIYAVGCILHEMLTGRWLFKATAMEDLRQQHLEASIPRLTNGNILPAPLNTLLARCVAKQRNERFAAVRVLLEELSLIYEQQFAETPRPVVVGEGFTAADYSNRAMTYARLHRFDEALADYTTAIQLDPTVVQAYTGRGATYASLHRYDEALADYAYAIRLAPTDAQVYVNRGNTYHDLERYEEAMTDFTRAIQLDPTLVQAYMNRGRTHASLECYEEALTDFTHATHLEPKHAKAYHNRGLVYATLQRYERALAEYTSAIRLDSMLVPAYINRGIAHAMLQHHDEALADFTQAIELDPNNTAAYSNRGGVYISLERYDDAVADLTYAIQLDPTDAKAYINRGATYFKTKRHDKALADLNRAIALDSTDAKAYFNRGNTQAALLRYEEALADQAHAIRLDPTYAEAYLSMGALLFKRDELQEALHYFEKAAQLGDPQGTEYAAQVRQRLSG